MILPQLYPMVSKMPCLVFMLFQGECGQVSEVIVEHVNGELLLNVSEQLHLTWSTTTHMTLLTLGQEVAAFIRDVKPPSGKWLSFDFYRWVFNCSMFDKGEMF